MPQEPSAVASHRLVRLAEKIHDKEYRDGYVAAHTRQVLAKQMREFRGETPQTEFAEFIGKRQTMVSRLENPSYVGWSLSTMFEVASRLNVAVFARFVDFPTFLKYSGQLSEEDLHPQPYHQQEVDDFARQEAVWDTLGPYIQINASAYQTNPLGVQMGAPQSQYLSSYQGNVLTGFQGSAAALRADEVAIAEKLKKDLDDKEREIKELKLALAQKEAEMSQRRAGSPYDLGQMITAQPFGTGRELVPQGM